MTLFRTIVIALGLLLALASPSFAEELTDAQREGLAARIESFDAAVRANDMKSMMGALPPKVLDKIAEKSGVPTDYLLEAMQQQIDEAMKTMTVVSFKMDPERAEAFTTESGLTYTLIPTETVIDVGANAGGKIRAKAATLALLDGGIWYLMRVEDTQQIAIVKEVYPAFTDVEFPAGTMEQVTE